MTLARTTTASEDEKEVGAFCVARRQEEGPKHQRNLLPKVGHHVD